MKQIDYSKYVGHTPGPWCRSRNDIYADCGTVFDWEPYEGGYFTNDDDYELIVDAPDLLAACRERDERITELEAALVRIAECAGDELSAANIALAALRDSGTEYNLPAEEDA